MKVYVHWSGTPEYTKVFSLSGEEAVLDVVLQFLRVYNNRCGAAWEADSVVVQGTGRREVQLTSIVKKVIKDKGDLFLSALLAETRDSTGPGPNLSSQPDPGLVPRGTEKTVPSVVLMQMIEGASDAFKQKDLLKAQIMYEQVLQLAPATPLVVRGLAEVWLAAGRPKKAEACLETGRTLEPAASPETLLLLGDCRLAQKDPEGALECYQQGLQVASTKQSLAISLRCARALRSVASPTSCSAAAVIVMDILRGIPDDFDALYEYAAIAIHQGLWEDAVRVLVRLLVREPANKGVKALLARAMEDPRGRDSLLKDLGSMQSDHVPSALAFLATAVRDEGAIEAAIQLCHSAVHLVPGSGSYQLNLAHVLELTHQYGEVVAVTQSFCNICKESLGPLVVQDAALLLASTPEFPQLPSLSWYLHETWHPPTTLLQRRREALENGGSEEDVPRCVDDDLVGVPQVLYTSTQLDVLALLFTVVKVLYVAGALPLAARLCQVVEPARRASLTPLHQTHIRNEAAYHGCILQLLLDHPPPTTKGVSAAQLEPPLFWCGDSHCLSGAWHYLTLRGRRCLLYPLLVTGLKVWHLRPASTFYPKEQFWNAIKALPRGSQLVMMFGEIDCREGLLLAVQKLKYDSLEEAICSTVDLYLEVLVELVVEQGHEVFVHPPPPVLDETRAVVLRFSQILGKRLGEVAQQEGVRGRLHWLEMAHRLLSEDGQLHPSLKFDGTHLAPAYLDHVQWALDQLEA